LLYGGQNRPHRCNRRHLAFDQCVEDIVGFPPIDVRKPWTGALSLHGFNIGVAGVEWNGP
jgi:hypothetical protein